MTTHLLRLPRPAGSPPAAPGPARGTRGGVKPGGLAGQHLQLWAIRIDGWLYCLSAGRFRVRFWRAGGVIRWRFYGYFQRIGKRRSGQQLLALRPASSLWGDCQYSPQLNYLQQRTFRERSPSHSAYHTPCKYHGSDVLVDLLGVEIIDDIIDESGDDLILLVVEQSLNHVVEVDCFDVGLDPEHQFLFVEGEAGEDAEERGEAVLELVVVALLHGPLHAAREDDVHAALEHDAELLHARLLQHQLQQQQHWLAEGGDLAQEEEELAEQRLEVQVRQQVRVLLVQQQVLQQPEAIRPALRHVPQRGQRDGTERVRELRLQPVGQNELPPLALAQAEEELHVLVELLALAREVLALRDHLAGVLDRLQQLLQVEVQLHQPPHQHDEVVLQAGLAAPALRAHLEADLVDCLRDAPEALLAFARWPALALVGVEEEVETPEVALGAASSRGEQVLEVAVELGVQHQPVADEAVAAVLLGQPLHAGQQPHVEVVLPALRQPLHL